jgi:hypothetical protein
VLGGVVMQSESSKATSAWRAFGCIYTGMMVYAVISLIFVIALSVAIWVAPGAFGVAELMPVSNLFTAICGWSMFVCAITSKEAQNAK